jgi:hypothetical protein
MSVIIHLLVVVNDLDLLGTRRRPGEADPPLLVDPNAVLSDTITTERLQPIARRHAKVLQPLRSIDHHQRAEGDALDPGSRPLLR